MENNLLKNQNTRNFSAVSWLNKIVQFSQLKAAGLAIWKAPQDDTIHILCDLDGGTTLEEVSLDDLEEGFLLAPFQSGVKNNLHFKADVKGNFKLGNADHSVNDSTEINWDSINESTENEIANMQMDQDISLKLAHYPKLRSTKKEDYIQAVQNGIEAIENGKMYKVVPSKIKCVSLENYPDIGAAYLRACQKYSDAFVSLTYSPLSGLWMGASPETLIEDKKDEYFKTVALAGTQAINEKSIAHTAWTQKEIEEQALVSRYIINCFKKIRLREYEEIGPKTVQAGKLLHLKTSYKVDTKSLNFPELASVMLKLLHPTSAVCGMPKEQSLEFLNKHETHERGYFSGFLGPVKMNNKSHIFVNLRCCQFTKDKVVFYAGAGITEDSEPEKEWQETEMKCQILSDMIFQL